MEQFLIVQGIFALAYSHRKAPTLYAPSYSMINVHMLYLFYVHKSIINYYICAFRFVNDYGIQLKRYSYYSYMFRQNKQNKKMQNFEQIFSKT